MPFSRAQFQRHAPQIHGKNLIKLISQQKMHFFQKMLIFLLSGPKISLVTPLRRKDTPANHESRRAWTSPYIAREGTAWVQFFAQLFLPPLLAAQKCVHAWSKTHSEEIWQFSATQISSEIDFCKCWGLKICCFDGFSNSEIWFRWIFAFC